jgi:hypothetical protein
MFMRSFSLLLLIIIIALERSSAQTWALKSRTIFKRGQPNSAIAYLNSLTTNGTNADEQQKGML